MQRNRDDPLASIPPRQLFRKQDLTLEMYLLSIFQDEHHVMNKTYKLALSIQLELSHLLPHRQRLILVSLHGLPNKTSRGRHPVM